MENNQFIQDLIDLEESLLTAKWSANDLIGHTGYFIRTLLDAERSYIRSIRLRMEETGENSRGLPHFFWKSLNELTDFLITLYRHDFIKRGILDNCMKTIGVIAEATRMSIAATTRMAG